jgi:hypothetical protein
MPFMYSGSLAIHKEGLKLFPNQAKVAPALMRSSTAVSFSGERNPGTCLHPRGGPHLAQNPDL